VSRKGKKCEEISGHCHVTVARCLPKPEPRLVPLKEVSGKGLCEPLIHRKVTTAQVKHAELWARERVVDIESLFGEAGLRVGRVWPHRKIAANQPGQSKARSGGRQRATTYVERGKERHPAPKPEICSLGGATNQCVRERMWEGAG